MPDSVTPPAAVALAAWLDAHRGQATARELLRAHVAGVRTAAQLRGLLDEYSATFPGSVTADGARTVIRSPASLGDTGDNGGQRGDVTSGGGDATPQPGNGDMVPSVAIGGDTPAGRERNNGVSPMSPPAGNAAPVDAGRGGGITGALERDGGDTEAAPGLPWRCGFCHWRQQQPGMQACEACGCPRDREAPR